jgi:hypothetical protein
MPESSANRKGKLLADVMFDLNRCTAFMCFGVETGEEEDKVATARWSEGEDDLVMVLAYLFREPWLTEEILHRALDISEDLRDADERMENDNF